MHYWGDEWPHWKDLHTAIYWCMDEMLKRARLGSHGKEKFGTYRHHIWLYSAEWPIHNLIKPAYVQYQWPAWMMHVELKLGKLVKLTRVDRIIRRYQYRVYREVLSEAAAKWPHIKEELTCDTQEYYCYY